MDLFYLKNRAVGARHKDYQAENDKSVNFQTEAFSYQEVLMSIPGVPDSFMSGVNKKHIMTSHVPGKLMGSNMGPWLGNTDFEIYVTHQMHLLPDTPDNDEHLGNQLFQYQLVQARKLLLGFSFFHNSFKGHIEGRGGPDLAGGQYA